MSDKPFKIAVGNAELEHLRKKLDLVRFPADLKLQRDPQSSDLQYGVPVQDIKRLVAYWKEGYDWRKSEAEINRLPMFTRDIDVAGFGTLNIHYLHQKSDVRGAIPLLFVHGWPGHFLEVRKLLPLLTASSPDHPSFHVVSLSLPGFAFSDSPGSPGFKGPQYAELVNKLMLALGYDEYCYAGWDWGHFIGLHAVTHYGKKHIKSWYTSMPVIDRPYLTSNPLLFLGMFLLPFDKEARAGYAKWQKFQAEGNAYSLEQATKPQTLGFSLDDSPVGLLAWIYEKLRSWTDDYPWTDDEVLEWISLYWFSRAGPAASTRIYCELTNGGTGQPFAGVQWQVPIPTGAAYFPGELARQPLPWAHLLGNLVFSSVHKKGGHFAAWENPGGMADDLRRMYGKGGPAFGVVPGRNGYDTA